MRHLNRLLQCLAISSLLAIACDGSTPSDPVVDSTVDVPDGGAQDVLTADADTADASVPIVFDFYISNDGDDSSDGQSPETAWQTITKLNSALGSVVVPGDSVGFRRGDTFNDATLDLTNMSGTSTNPTSVGAYGSGDKPLLTGRVALHDSWTHLGSDVWSYDLSAAGPVNVRYVRSNGLPMNLAKSPVRFADDSSEGLFSDADLGGADGDYVGSEAVMRTSNYTWEVRNVGDYTAATGVVTLNAATSYDLTELTTGNTGYFFQNSRHILEQNATEGEWATDGSTLYIYSATDPYDLPGEIEVSALDVMVNLADSSHIHLDSLHFTFVNTFAVYGSGADHKAITNCDFNHVVYGVWDNSEQLEPTVQGCSFTDVGTEAVKLYTTHGARILDNTFFNIAVEIGRAGFISASSAYWGYNAINLPRPDGGLVQYNNIENVGYCGIKLSFTDGGIRVENNFVKNSNLVLVDGGAYYTWEVDNITKVGGTFADNIAVFDDYDSEDYAIGRQNGLDDWLLSAFYKDGYERDIHYVGNFAFGYPLLYYSNPATNCEWTNNVGASARHRELHKFVHPFRLNGVPGYPCQNNVVEGNTWVAFHRPSMPYWQRIARLDLAGSLASSNNVFNDNKLLQPSGIWHSSNHVLAYVDGDTPADKTLQDWRSLEVHQGHDQSNLMTMDMSGLSDPEEFLWYAVNPTQAAVSVSFPAGYRYYTVDGDPVTSDTLEPYKGSLYFRTIDEAMPQVSAVSFTGSAETGSTLTSVALSTIYSHGEGNLEAGSEVQWYVSLDNSVAGRNPVPAATSSTYVPLQADGFDGSTYVILGIKPRSAGAPGQLLVGVERFSAPTLVALGP